jgi:AcrR family transcriptional regulator
MAAGGSRPYVMRARADAKMDTRQRILGAIRAIAEETLEFEPTLDAIAARAGVSVQTVLRHFGSRDALFDAAVVAGNAEVEAEREVPAGDVPAALKILVAHYELRGDFVIGMLAHEPGNERIARITGPGRDLHRRWVSQVFAPLLPSQRAQRDVLVDLLVVVTDVYTWKILRRDRKLTRAQTQARMLQLVTAVLISGSPA